MLSLKYLCMNIIYIYKGYMSLCTLKFPVFINICMHKQERVVETQYDPWPQLPVQSIILLLSCLGIS